MLYLVHLPLLPEGFAPARLARSPLTWTALALLLEGGAEDPLELWPLCPRVVVHAEADERVRVEAALRARTRDLWHLERDEGLLQCVRLEREGAVHGHYLFDEAYAAAHPEALDLEHLELLHGTVAAKVFDEGELVVDDLGLRASLHWRSGRARSRRLTRAGGR